MNNVIEILRARGLFEDQTSAEVEKLVAQPTTVYAGFDPTSTSLQAGNFVTIMALAHFQRCGHKVVALVGGATGLIGDPSGKASERQLLSEEQVELNPEGIRENLSRFLDFEHPTAPAVIVNNNDWHKEFSFVRFLREDNYGIRLKKYHGLLLDALYGRWPIDEQQARIAGDRNIPLTVRWNSFISPKLFSYYFGVRPEQLENEYRNFCNKLVYRVKVPNAK